MERKKAVFLAYFQQSKFNFRKGNRFLKNTAYSSGLSRHEQSTVKQNVVVESQIRAILLNIYELLIELEILVFDTHIELGFQVLLFLCTLRVRGTTAKI